MTVAEKWNRLPVRMSSAPTAAPIHNSGIMARRDQPRADLQCRTIRVRTMPVITNPTSPSIVLSVFQADREPSPMSSTLAGQLALQPLNAGFQNIVAAVLNAMFCT